MPLSRSAAFVLLTVVTLGCSGGGAGQGPSPAGAPVDGGTATVAETSDFDAFNELVSTDYDTNQVMDNMLFVTLIRFDEKLGYQPYLADSFALADDGLSMTFHLRDDMKWHDGEPVTADDVVWTAEMAMNPEIAYANLIYFQFVKDVVKVDERTVRFDFTEVHAEPESDFVDWNPMPKHLLVDIPPADMRNAEFNRHPVGCGPFRFVSWDANQQAVFEADTTFPLGRPHLDRVVFRVIPEQTTQLTELFTGGIDLMRAVPPAEMERVKSNDDVYTVVYPARSYTFIAWNERNPLFEDAKVRRALTMAIDRKAIVDALLYGYGRIATVDVMPFQWMFDESIEQWPYDPEGARKLFAEAGWSDHDGDGIIDKDGRPFRFTLQTNKGNDLREDITVIVQSDLAKVGVDAQPRLTEWNTLITALKAKDYEAAVSGWSVDFKFNPTDLFATSAIEGKYNYPSFSDPRADSLMQAALKTVHREDALPLWKRYERVIHEQQPYTFLYYLYERLGVNDRLHGVKADARGHLISIADWWIPKDRQGPGSAPLAARSSR